MDYDNVDREKQVLTWTQIRIGYLARSTAKLKDLDFDRKRKFENTIQNVLRDALSEEARERWQAGGETTLPSKYPTGSDHERATAILNAELHRGCVNPDMYLGCGPSVHGRMSDELLHELRTDVKAFDVYSGVRPKEPGTSCELVGNQWVNSRSYAVHQNHVPYFSMTPQCPSEGRPWMPVDPDSPMLTVTLTWPCPHTP